MLTTSVLSFALVVLAQTPVPSTNRTLPPDWPPPPDFKTPVDYVKWLEDRMNQDTSAEAGRLAAELFEQADDSDAVRQAKRRAWSQDENGSLAGLFTGDKTRPNRYAWDPKDHPDWEKAFQANDRLRPKLLAFCRGKRPSVRQAWGLPQPEGKTLDFGFTREDRITLTMLLPSRAPERLAVKVLLQNAWRAPNGRGEPDRLLEAITASVQLAQHIEQPVTSFLDHLVAIAIRGLAYETALHALCEGTSGRPQIDAMCHWLSRNDSRNLTRSYTYADEVAEAFDVLQYVYLPPETGPTGSPAPDPQRLRKLVQYLRACRNGWPKAYGESLDIETATTRYDPQTGLQQAVNFYLAILDVTRRKPPQEAAAAMDRLFDDFEQDTTNHVLLRQFLAVPRGRCLLIATRAETCRRATQVIYALHLEHARTGRWPTRLSELRSVPRTCRTDPFSGKDFIYRVENGSPILYSVAMNGKDDGGKHDAHWGEGWTGKDNNTPIITDTDYVFWPVQPDR